MTYLRDCAQWTLAPKSSMRFTYSCCLMPRTSLTAQTRTLSSAGTRLGERLRQLRVAAGMTQTDLAGARFSKEYVSQIERGKSRPTGETIEWLAARLGVEPAFLERGASTEDRMRIETALAQADALVESNDYEAAVSAIATVTPSVA